MQFKMTTNQMSNNKDDRPLIISTQKCAFFKKISYKALPKIKLQQQLKLGSTLFVLPPTQPTTTPQKLCGNKIMIALSLFVREGWVYGTSLWYQYGTDKNFLIVKPPVLSKFSFIYLIKFFPQLFPLYEKFTYFQKKLSSTFQLCSNKQLYNFVIFS